MKTKKSDFVEQVTFRVNDDTVKAIRKSGQSAPDWLRQAARNRIDSERQAETPTSHLEKQLAALQQPIDDLKQNGADLRREIVKLQQSDAIAQAAQAEMRKALATIQNNQVALHRELADLDKNFGDTLNRVGPALLSALSQMLKAHEEPPKRPLPPPLPRTRL